MIPYTFILEPELKIFKIYNGYWYWGRPSITQLREDLMEVTKSVRPDWDIEKPELIDAWDNDHKDLFYPYNQ